MIVDTLANHQLYHNLSPRLATALAHLAATDFSQYELGNYPIEGKDIFAIVNDYQTKPKHTESFESHQRYIDVQFVVSGEEEFGYLPLADQAPLAPYHNEHDYSKYDYEANKADAAFIPLKAGMFAIFFPEDMHMPGTSDTPKSVRKVVIKVKV
ncbi:YhcH/YjgK/YiaL family protein [Shewanella sp. UCD-KL21]|uniref:YhcH/YjgK/YiaL family protein n=1 Tax=Shewanella sp. UCD-KL21 TaxID=1917164 RepID=UPI000970DDF0|nr:YhcH/YjgK/YiaL family protein [Shewanella sp. UCD-KL21]